MVTIKPKEKAGPFYGGGLPPDFWNEALKGVLKGEIARKNLKYPDLVKRLAEIGVKENEANLRNKISRGNFSAIFLLQCLLAIGAGEVRIPRFPHAPGHDPDEALVRKWEQENR